MRDKPTRKEILRRVWVVTRGSDDDYCIQAVFGSKKLAENYVDNGGGDAIEEYEVDAEAGKVLRRAFVCRVDHVTGSVADYDNDHTMMASPRARSGPTRGNAHHGYSLTYSFVSMEHARKLAEEERRRRIKERTA